MENNRTEETIPLNDRVVETNEDIRIDIPDSIPDCNKKYEAQNEHVAWLHEFSTKKSAITLTLNTSAILTIIFALIRLTNGKKQRNFAATLTLLVVALLLQITMALSQLYFSAQGVDTDKTRRKRVGIINNIIVAVGFSYVLVTVSVQALYILDCCQEDIL